MLGTSPKLGLQSPGKDRDKQEIASSLSSLRFQFMERSILISKTPPIFFYTSGVLFCVLFFGVSSNLEPDFFYANNSLLLITAYSFLSNHNSRYSRFQSFR